MGGFGGILAVIVFALFIAYVLCYNDEEHQRRLDNQRKKKRGGGWTWVDSDYNEERRAERHYRRAAGLKLGGKGKLNRSVARKPRKTL